MDLCFVASVNSSILLTRDLNSWQMYFLELLRILNSDIMVLCYTKLWELRQRIIRICTSCLQLCLQLVSINHNSHDSIIIVLFSVVRSISLAKNMRLKWGEIERLLNFQFLVLIFTIKNLHFITCTYPIVKFKHLLYNF